MRVKTVGNMQKAVGKIKPVINSCPLSCNLSQMHSCTQASMHSCIHSSKLSYNHSFIQSSLHSGMHTCFHASKLLLYGMAILFMFFISSSCTFAQNDLVYSDSTGILRWTKNNEEASFFGVNYASPFAYSYRALNKIGIPVKEAIDADVSHFARLELNAYRIHVWDREVSDKEGNLINNEHLELFDYLLHKLKEKGVYVILTPIAWWGTGWPEPDLKTEGFSTFYSKVEMITNPEARKAQVNYLKQFLNHVNKYDNVKYKDDSNIIAFEIINEPHHPADTTITASYIKEMYTVFRNEGITKPLYYNISENWNKEQAAVVYNSDVQGISFQWYPTGLVKGSELTGNFLSHVDHYPVPKTDSRNFKTKTRMVYEFDAADVGKSYMYPAMARSFREAGMQWATMFCYDPMYLAAYNTEYQTHYLNLIYTPQKALGLLIASNVFKEIEVYRQFPSYPGNLNFGDFRISYEDNLSEMNSAKKFYYTNNTGSKPKDITALEHIAGYGSSPVVQTESRGSYFIDKISTGIWRLEVYPDVVWLKDPFGKNSLNRKVAEIFFNESEFNISLPELTENYFLYNIIDNKSKSQQANKGTITVKPGVYILSHEELSEPSDLKFNYDNISLNDFSIPKDEDKTNVVKNNSAPIIFEDGNGKIDIEAYSNEKIKEVQLYIRGVGWGRFNQSVFTKKDKYKYYADIPPQFIKNGSLEYCVTILTGKDTLTYPGNLHGNPNEWDYEPSSLWKIKILPQGNPIVLFDPRDDYKNVVFPGIWDKLEYSSNIISDKNNEDLLEITFNKFKKPLNDFTFQIELDDLLKTIDTSRIKDYKNFRINIINEKDKIDSVYFRYIPEGYTSETVPVKLHKKGKQLVSLKDFKKDKFVLLPRPYPGFLPYYYSPNLNDIKNGGRINYLQFTIPMEGYNEKNNVSRIRIGKIELVSDTQKNEK